MNVSRRLGHALRGALICSGLVPAARAAPCGRPDVDFTYPYTGALGVPSNATFSAHYAAPASYANEDVVLSDSSGAPLTINAPAYDDALSVLHFDVPQLPPGAYTLSWPALKGVNGGIGRGSTISFVAKAAADAEAPRFQGLTAIDWDLAREHDPCLTGLEDRYAFELTLGAASDDSDVSLLRVLLFESVRSGTRLSSAAPLLTLPFPASGKLQVKRSTEDTGTTCFKARVLDLTGADSGGGEPEVCRKTQKPPFFEGCALAAGPPQVGSGGLLSVLLFGLLLRRGASANARRRRA